MADHDNDSIDTICIRNGMETNGKHQEAPTAPTLTLVFDQQTCGVAIKMEGYKSLEMVLATLLLAKSKVEFDLNVARMGQLQQAQMQAAQEMQVRQQLKL